MEPIVVEEGRPAIRAASRRGVAIGLGLLVTFLWASSVVLLRLGLSEEVTAPIGFAGVRFTLAALLLLPLAWPHLRAAGLRRAAPRSLARVFVYGVLMFGVSQIALHVALGTVSASTIGLMIGLTPVVTALIMLRGSRERLNATQGLGVMVLALGVLVYFGLDSPTPAVLLAAVVPVAVGVASVIGRGLAVDVERYGGPLGLTSMAMIVGGLVTLIVALAVEGVPRFSLWAWLLILWMAAINTAFTYTLWTQVMRTLRAVESSVLGDVTVFLTALLGWLVLGEALGAIEIVGLVLTVAGVAIVQLAPTLRARLGP